MIRQDLFYRSRFCTHHVTLLKVCYAAFKDFLILFKRNVFVEVFTLTLTVSHLSEDSAVGRGDTLNRAD